MKIKGLLAGIGIVLILGIFWALSLYFKDYVSPIPEGTVGNTAGNIRGGGKFCEYDGKVYFANPYDEDALYVMNPDGTDLEKICGTSVACINAGGNYLFYYLKGSGSGTGLGYVRGSSGVFRCKLDGSGTFCLNNDRTTMMVLYGNNLFYQHYDNDDFSTFQRLSVDNSKESTLLIDGIVETANMVDGRLYYSDTVHDHYLHCYNTESGTDSVIWKGNLCFPTVIGSWVYYMDIEHNYRLCRYELNEQRIEILTKERLDYYSVYEDVIYYQTAGKKVSALKRMNIDGSNVETVAEGAFSNLNITSTYTYFYPFGEDSIVYRTPTRGGIYVDNFQAALDAALEHAKQ